jgi:hypothetical protein
MSWFADRIDEIREPLAGMPGRDGTLLAVCAAVAATAAVGMPGARCRGEHAEFSIFRIAAAVSSRVSSGVDAAFADFDEPNYRAAAGFAVAWKGLADAAPMARPRDGDPWLFVRDERSGEVRLLSQAGLAGFGAAVAARGGVINMVTIDEGRVAMARYAGGRLEGLESPSGTQPAVRVVQPDGSARDIYTSLAGQSDGPAGREPQEPGDSPGMSM